MSTTPLDIFVQIQKAKAKKRKTLDLDGRFSDQKLTKIPEEVFELDHLEELALPNHAITTIPDQIKQLKQLKILDLTGNPLKRQPEKVAHLSSEVGYLSCSAGHPEDGPHPQPF